MEDPDGPGKGGDQCDRKVVPEGLVVAVEIGAEAGKIVLKEEDAEEFRRAELDEHVPRGRDGEEDGEPQRVEGADEGSRISLGEAEGDEDEGGESGGDGTFGEGGQGVEGVKEAEEFSSSPSAASHGWPIFARFWQM